MPKLVVPPGGRRVSTLAFVLLAAVAGRADALSDQTVMPPDEDREAVLAALGESRDLFVERYSGLTKEQFHYRPAPDRWSLAEIAEHLVLVDGVVYNLVLEPLLHSEPHPEWTRDGRPLINDHVIRMAVTNRTARRFEAPPQLSPQGRFETAPEAVAAFLEARRATLNLAELASANMRVHFYENPALGMLDGWQWLLFAAAHVERHLEQAAEVVADPGFPAAVRESAEAGQPAAGGP